MPQQRHQEPPQHVLTIVQPPPTSATPIDAYLELIELHLPHVVIV